MSFKTKVSIIIINWNGYQDTVECLKSLKNIVYRNIEIIVVDNGSENEEYLKIQNKFYDITILKSKNNLGFAGGNNLGIEFVLNNDSDFILLLNNDTIVEPDFLEPLIKIFKKEKRAGIVAPQINYYNEPKKIWSAGGKISQLRGSGFAFSNKFKSNFNSEYSSNEFVSGCCMLIKPEVFKTIGLFDENYFLYLEDTDLCYRTLQAGYKIFTSYSSKIYHKVSNSTSKDLSQLPLYYSIRNRLYFSKKNYYKTFMLTLLYLIITMLFKSLVWGIQGKIVNIKTVFKAFYDFFNGSMGKVVSFKL